ncbi:ciliary rootlet coiled-coil, rootletin isoform X3 [Rhodnius prolixus]|uniref:ciliary rootlet coiled-coil, rootletin isoform X3 n=1 Tax=Rhodnius prolixus TaxID=13249 RepID=UPI003D18B3E1
MQYANWYIPGRTRMDGASRSGGSIAGDIETAPEYLSRQNIDLRRRLEDEAATYRRRLETYKQAQQQQAALVSRLQAKVLQYKQRCSELEGQMEEVLDRPPVVAPPGSALEAAQLQLRELREERVSDLDTALRALHEEKRKTEKMAQINMTLRQQLEEAHESNEALTSDLQKLTSDWEVMREEMIIKEDEWKEEEQCFNDYYSNEHARLLSLWRDVVAMKRQFTEMQSATQRDLIKMKADFSNTTRDLMDSCTGIHVRQSRYHLAEEESKQQNVEEITQLKEALSQLRAEREQIALDAKIKEEKIQSLNKDCRSLEERCTAAESTIGDVTKLQAELELLQSALRDIAHAVLQDAETRDPDTHHVHLTPSQPLPPRSPKRIQRTPTSPMFVESTISAVQAALHKNQLQIHDLQVKLASCKEQCSTWRKQAETCEESHKTLEIRLAEVTAQLDTTKALVTQFTQEKDMLLKSLDSARAEKNALDKNRIEMNAMLDSINTDYEKEKKLTGKLQKIVDTLEDEKSYLLGEIEQLKKEAGIREMNLQGEEDRCSRLKEEILTLREELNKAYLAKDLLEQQKSETDSLLSQIDKTRGDIELELEQVLLEKSDMHESLAKAESLAAALEAEKKKLQEEMKKILEERTALQNQVADQNSDLASLRKEILQAEQMRLDLDSEKVSLHEKCKFLEMEKEKVELELGQVARERSELSNQLAVAARKRETLGEEVSRIKQRLEQANETNARINRSLEDLVKDAENKQVLLEGHEKEIQRLQEQIASMRADKEALEATLFDCQTNVENLDTKRNQLERDQQELLVYQESLKGEISKLKSDLESSEKKAQETKTALLQQSGSMEGEYKQTIANLKKKMDEAVAKLSEEKEQVRAALEKKALSSLETLANEKDQEIKQLLERIAALQQQIESTCQQHEEVLLRAESEKQQALLIAQQDHQAVVEKLEEAKREIEAERQAHDRNRRDAAVRSEQDRATINSLRDSLNATNAKLDQLRVRSEEEKGMLENRWQEVCKERDSETQHCEDLKLQLHLAEDKVDALQVQLNDTTHRLKDVENTRDSLLKELTDVRRQLADATFEKEKYSSSNKELREHVKRVEGQKREGNRSLEEALQKITSLEDGRRNLDVERGRLQTLVRELDRSLLEHKQQLASLNDELSQCKEMIGQKTAEERQLQARINSQAEERDRAQQQVHQLSKQVLELENAIETSREEAAKNRNKGDEEERRWREREEELLMRLEDSRAGERKLQDQSHNLEVCLADATQQIQELKARLGGSEGRVRALDAQLQQLEGQKREVEQKLTSIGSTLRRIAGIQLDGTVNLPYKLLSPTRRWSPVRAAHQETSDGSRVPAHDVVLDVDPEWVRKGVRTLMQQVAQVERERDDLKAQAGELKKQMRCQTDELTRTESKLNATLAALRDAQEEKGSLEARLGQKSAALQSQLEAMQCKSEESQHLQDRLTAVEMALRTCHEEKTSYEEKLEKLRQQVNRCDSEKRTLQDDLAKTEARATKLELQRMGMEGDIQRLQLMLTEKEAAIQKLQERVEHESSTVAELEERCGSLKSTVDQLNQSLERAGSTERELNNEIHSLQKTLADASSTSQSNVEKLKSLQKAVYNAENEKRVAVERLEAAQSNLNELRRSYQNLKEVHSRLQAEMAQCEVEKSSLEAQLRMANWPNDNEELKRQASDLNIKLDTLQDKVRQLESEKRSLERKLHASRSKSYERGEKGSREWDVGDSVIGMGIGGGGGIGGSTNLLLEQENIELKARVRSLEAELSKKEAELLRLKSLDFSRCGKEWSSDVERYKSAQLQTERLLEAREQSHRQQVLRLENQIKMLRDQLNQEVKRRQMFILRSGQTGREVQQLHRALDTSLRNVSQDPGLDAYALESETRKLDTSLATVGSQPIALPPPQSRSSRK